MIRTKDRIASGLGSILEWYDFSLYGFFAPLLAQLFFPSSSSVNGLLKSFAVFGIGFIARPIGAIIFGNLADTQGRVKCLKLTPILITLPTFLIACLPDYKTLGLASSVLLVILRLVQGICIGGEFSNNIVYLCESAPANKRYFLGSIGSCTGSLGILLASSIAVIFYSFFSKGFMSSYGWRIAFGISFCFGTAVYCLRKKLAETEVYLNLSKQNKKLVTPFLQSIKNQKLDYLKALGLIYLSATAFYFVFIFLPAYLNAFQNVHIHIALDENSFSLFIRIFFILSLGTIADKVGGLLLTKIACIGFIVFSCPLFYLLNHYPNMAFYSLYAFALLTTLNAASLPGLLVNMLKPDTRSTILSLTFNFGFGVFGGMVPFMGFLLAKQFSRTIAPPCYLMFAAVVTLVTTMILTRDNKYVD